MADSATSLLELRDVETSYGLSRVLFGISLNIGRGEMVSLCGRNQVFPGGKIWEHLAPFRNEADTTLGDAIGRKAADFVTLEADGPSRRRR